MKNLKAFGPLLLAVFTDLIGFGIALPVLPGLFLSANGILPIGTPYATRTIILGFILGLFPLIQIFSAPILGALADRHGRKPILLLSFAGTLVGYLMFAIGIVTSQLWLLVLGRAIDGATADGTIINSANKPSPKGQGLLPTCTAAVCPPGATEFFAAVNDSEMYSWHTGGNQVLFADGSMHFINQNISLQTLGALLTRQGGDIPGDY